MPSRKNNLKGLYFVGKIAECRKEISRWRKNEMLPERETISELTRALEEIQNDDNCTQEELVEMTRKLKEAYNNEELYWQQKSTIMWLKKRDNNYKFFHAQTKQRRARN